METDVFSNRVSLSLLPPLRQRYYHRLSSDTCGFFSRRESIATIEADVGECIDAIVDTHLKSIYCKNCGREINVVSQICYQELLK